MNLPDGKVLTRGDVLRFSEAQDVPEGAVLVDCDDAERLFIKQNGALVLVGGIDGIEGSEWVKLCHPESVRLPARPRGGALIRVKATRGGIDDAELTGIYYVQNDGRTLLPVESNGSPLDVAEVTSFSQLGVWENGVKRTLFCTPIG
jgi:hypothetical protein